MKRFLFFAFLVGGFNACTNDELPEPTVIECDGPVTYTDTVKMIIDQSCAYEGCHVAGFGSGNFTSYDGLQGAINSGSLKERATEIQNMPPSNVPEGKPSELTDEELELVQCWISDGYPE